MSDQHNGDNHIPPEIEAVMDAATKHAVDTLYNAVTLDHLFLALLDNEHVAAKVKEANIHPDRLARAIGGEVRSHSPNISITRPEEIVASTDVMAVLARSVMDVMSKGRSNRDVRGEDIMHIILESFYERMDVTSMIIDATDPKARERIMQTLRKSSSSSSGQEAVETGDFVTDLTELAKEGKIDPVIGRETEIHEITEILARKKKNNAMLLGRPGVGKTAVVEGIALAIHEGKCDESLKEKRVMAVDVAGMLAGTKYRGEFEERARNVFKYLADEGDVIVFIDEAHTVMGAGASTQGGVDLGNILKPMLARGDLMCIAATTNDEYKTSFEKDKAMVRRFQNYTVSEPSIERTKEIISKLLPVYEKFHGIQYDTDSLDHMLKLCDRYIQNRAFPDKAIDVMDAVGAFCKVNKTKTVTKNEVEVIVARISKVPVESMRIASDEKKIVDVSAEIKKNLYGQDHVVDIISDEVIIAKSGLKEENKPMGCFLLSGTSGVGKTELARQLSNTMGVKLIKYDMSEFQEAHSVAKLIGAPPGYVGYDENAAKLIDDIEENPNCVLLLDEVEKAHPKVLTVLLQIMDDAKVTSSQGKTVSFKDTIIIMTTNLGAREKNHSSIGFKNENHKTADTDAITKFFAPEFVNRLSSICAFNNLDTDAMAKIVDKEIVYMNRQLAASGIKVFLRKSAHAKLVKDGYDPAMGARPLKRLIKDKIKKPLSRDIVFGNIKEGSKIMVGVRNDEFVIEH